MTSPPNIKRELSSWEKHRSWIIVAAIATFFSCSLTSVLWLFGSHIRGYTFMGLTWGILAVVLALITFLYSARKRLFQERTLNRFKGTMMAWLWGHVYLGLFALLAASIHAGYGLLNFDLSTGTMLYCVFFLLIGSGVVWRLVYNRIPKQAVKEVYNYSQEDTLTLAQDRLLSMEKLAAGKSDNFHKLKELFQQETIDEAQVTGLITQLPPEEQTAVSPLRELAASHQRATQRYQKQGRYHKLLQSWRYAHIPLVFIFVPLLIIHIIAVFDIPAKIVPAPLIPALGGFQPAEDCAECHQAIYDQWSESMHAHAMNGPIMIVQTNQAMERSLNNETLEVQLVCNNCHGPSGMLLTGQETPTLPLEGNFFVSDEMANEGVNCVTCHQFAGESASASAAFLPFQDHLVPGRVYLGNRDDPVGNAYHQSEFAPLYEDTSLVCYNCHNVELDINGDGRKNDPGIDLVLQQTYNEYLNEYDGPDTCVSCHMPLTTLDRSAEEASILLEQDRNAPERVVRSHGFIGVDYPLDKVGEDPNHQLEERTELLRSAATFSIDTDTVELNGNTLTFAVNVDNNNLGHRLPTGFAFARQMWVEIIVRDQNGSPIFGSGFVANNTDDLCDKDTMDDVLAEFMQGCTTFDPQLVNFQQKLVTDVAPLTDDQGNLVTNQLGETIGIQDPNGVETVWQHLNGGAAARIRPFDGQAMTRILINNDERTFFYQTEIPFSTTEITIDARLRFRNLPPYFVRALAAHQSPDDEPQLAPMVGNLQIIDMAEDVAVFSLQ
ncbi:MAG TPA: multiheme c-type cytochrome [Anaerolineae bacterium]|nr:multiheme c-type cytochrome [Anaerolineae bacterium]